MGHPADLTNHLLMVLGSVSEVKGIHWQVMRKSLVNGVENYVYPAIVWSRTGVGPGLSWDGGVSNLIFNLEFHSDDELNLNLALYAVYDAIVRDPKLTINAGFVDSVLPEGSILSSNLGVIVT